MIKLVSLILPFKTIVKQSVLIQTTLLHITTKELAWIEKVTLMKLSRVSAKL